MGFPGGGEISRCFYPFKFDPYGRGCSHNCLYCYSRSVNAFRGNWNEHSPAKAATREIWRQFESAWNGRDSQNSRLLRSGLPLRFGGMSDPFSDPEPEARLTLMALTMLRAHDHPHLILTKGALVGQEPYIGTLSPKLSYVQVSVSTPYDDVSSVVEPGAPVTSERLRALKDVADAGIYTAARINPLFPLAKDGHYSNGVQSDKLRHFGWELLDMLAEAKVKTVIAGFLRLSTWNLRWLKEATGEDYSRLFDENTKQKNTALHFSREEKRWYYEQIKKRCDELGMAFSVCYDGDENYETFRYLWANQNDCCNGLGNVFANTWEGVEAR